MAQKKEVCERKDLIKRILDGSEGRDWNIVLIPRADEFHSKIEVFAKHKDGNRILWWDNEIEGGSYDEVKKQLKKLEQQLKDLNLCVQRRGWVGAKEYGSEERGQIVSLALVVGSILVLALWCVAVELHKFIPPSIVGASQENLLLRLVLALGVIGSSLRGVGELFNDVGNRRFDAAWSLSYLMRPLEGAGMALVIYLAVRGGMHLLSTDQAPKNALGYLFVAALAGMFSHRAVDGLRNRFDRFFLKS